MKYFTVDKFKCVRCGASGDMLGRLCRDGHKLEPGGAQVRLSIEQDVLFRRDAGRISSLQLSSHTDTQ